MTEAINKLGSFATPVFNAKSEQQMLGHAEMSKYEAIFLYFTFRVEEEMNKMDASAVASFFIHKSKTTTYKARKIRDNADEYLLTDSITKNAQGKHSKRVSVLDDEDIKKKIIQWFSSQPMPKRNIGMLQEHLKTVILPKTVENDTLNDETEVEGAVVKPLSDDCLRRKLISWGFHFQRRGNIKLEWTFVVH